MSDDKPDEAQTKDKFKSWINEVLDERQKAADDAAEEKAKKDADDKAKRTSEPLSALRQLIGF